MAITRSQTKTGSGTSTTTVSFNMDSVFATDDFLIVTVAINGGGAVTSVGWADSVITAVTQSLQRLPNYPVSNPGVEGGGVRLEKWVIPRLPATANVPTITVTVSPSTAGIAVLAETYASVRRFQFLDVYASNTNDGTSCATGTTGTTSEDAMLCHACWGWYTNAAVTIGATNSFTGAITVAAGTACSAYAAYKVISAAAAVSSTLTIASSVDMAAGVDTFRTEPSDPPTGSAVGRLPILKALSLP